MKGGSTNPRTGDFGRPLMSPSQCVKLEACERRWGFRYLEGLEETTGAAAELGTGGHRELELWNNLKLFPTSKAGRKASKFAPAPGLAEAEVPVRYDFDGVCWHGFIDLVYGWQFTPEAEHDPLTGGKPAGTPCELGETDTVVVHDWKFTGSLRNAKSPEELKIDPAACVYAYEAFLAGAKRVLGRWVYVEYSGSYGAKDVWFEFSLETVRAVVRELSAAAQRAYEYRALHKKKRLKVLDLSSNTDHCDAWRRKCDFYDRCQPKRRLGFGGKKMSTNKFTEDMAKRFPTGGDKKGPPPPPPAAGKAPPPPPAKKAGPPPPPAKKEILSAQDKADMASSREPGVPEKGFVNPNEAPDVASRSPEEAVKHQNIKLPPPPPPDDLDALEGDEDAVRKQLLAIGAAIEAFPANTRIRTPNLKVAIRAKRKELAAKGDKPNAEPEPTCAAAAQEPAHFTAEPEMLPETPSDDVSQEAASDDTDRAIAAAMDAVLGASDLHFVLHINCALVKATPLKHPTKTWRILSQEELVAYANGQLGCDWRFIDFKAAPELSACVREALESGAFGDPNVICVDTRTAAGAALVDMLSELAAVIVRGTT